MQRTIFRHSMNLKHIFYLMSILILFFLSFLILIQAAFDFTSMNFFQTITNHGALSLLIIGGSVLFICFFLLIERLLTVLSERSRLLLCLICGAFCITVQALLLFHFKPVLRYDHLQVFDGAWEIIHTGRLSLTDRGGYFGLYPFNIAITIFNSIILRILLFFGITESHSMLALQCVYLFFIDLGVFFSRQIVKRLLSEKNATLFTMLCYFNPILYVCAAGCYTTTLMLPLLMGTLLLIICFLREKNKLKKAVLGFFFGAFLTFGSILRATVFIAAIALGIYLMIRERSSESSQQSRKQAVILILAIAAGSALSYGSFTSLKNSYVTESYKDSQMPPIYYLMFAANPETKGIYNEKDFQIISDCSTLEEKNAVSFQILKERIRDMGLFDAFSLANHKLALTWSDGTEDYSDFWIASKNYGSLHSLIFGDRKDFFALYCHIFHFSVMGMLLISVISAFRKKCSSPYYLIFLTLLGGMVFHIFWESYYIYSLGFSMLIHIPASESLYRLSEKQNSSKNILRVASCALVLLIFAVIPFTKAICLTKFEHRAFAVTQDMSAGEQFPLLSGDCITQTFQTDRPFDIIGCKVWNPAGAENRSRYRMELFSENELLTAHDFYGSEAFDKDYYYMEIPLQIPEETTAYTIRITPLDTSAEHYLTFTCYNTQYYDIYADGYMTGPGSGQKTDLTFSAFLRITANFFHR